MFKGLLKFSCLLWLFIALTFVCQPNWVTVLADYPALDEYITDKANILTTEQKSDLKNKLKTYQEETGSQLAVLIVQDLNSEDIEGYANKVFEESGLGQDGLDNGLLLLISMQDKQIRLEVGYGLEGDITDAQTKKIIDSDITPYFKESKYYLGIDKGIEAITAIETTVAETNSKSNESSLIGNTMAVLLLGGFVGGIFWLFKTGKIKRSLNRTSKTKGTDPEKEFRKSRTKDPKKKDNKPEFGGGSSGGAGSSSSW